MKVRRAHKIALDPTPEQTDRFNRAAGTARFVWNWALAEWNRLFKCGEKPNAMDLKKRFNAVKGDEFPWVYESPRDANAQPFADLQAAFRNFFAGRARRPRFKKKNKCRDSFYVANDKFSLDGRYVRLPKIGHVKMREALRFHGKILGARVSRTADRWFLSVQVETESRLLSLSKDDAGESQDGVIGVDLGIDRLAVLSDGTTFANPKPLRKALRKLQRRSRQLSRKVKGSANYAKAARKLARLHARIADLRSDALHKLTTWLVACYRHVVIEDLNIKGMLRNGRLARAIADVGWGELRRQLAYKAEAAGTVLTVADRWYPSSKTCSGCGAVKTDLALGDRICECASCGLVIDRDLNAAVNLERYPGLSGESDACGHLSAGLVDPELVEGGGKVKLGWLKQEFNACSFEYK